VTVVLKIIIIVILAIIAIYMVIGLIGIIYIALCELIKTVLFNPHVNTIISIIVLLFEGLLVVYNKLWFLIIPIIMAIVDCIRDFAKANEYYGRVCDADPFYRKKSLLSLVTLGSARVIYLFYNYNKVRDSVIAYIDEQIISDRPLECHGHYKLVMENNFYKQRIIELKRLNKIVSNEETAEHERQMVQKNIDRLYPKASKDRDKYLSKLSRYSGGKIYIRKETLNKYSELIPKAMANKGPMSLSDIKRIKELKHLNLCSIPEIDFFIIQALQPLVESGVFEDITFNDVDPFDVHVYRYVQSSVPMKHIDGDNDPLFALN